MCLMTWCLPLATVLETHQEDRNLLTVRLQDKVAGETRRQRPVAIGWEWPVFGTVKISLHEICFWARTAGEAQSLTTQPN